MIKSISIPLLTRELCLLFVLEAIKFFCYCFYVIVLAGINTTVLVDSIILFCACIMIKSL